MRRTFASSSRGSAPRPPGSSSRTATSTTSAASPTSPREPAPRSGCRRESASGSSVPGVRARRRRGPTARTRALVSGGETIEVAGISFECLAVPATRPRTSRSTPTGELFSGDLLFAGSVGRVDLPGADWDTLLASVRMLAERLPPETVVHPGHGPETTLGVELARNPFLAELRARARERSSRRRAGRTTSCRATACGGASIRTIEEQCAQYGWSAHPDAGVRGHGALRAHVRRGLGRRAQGDVHVRRSRRPLAHAAAGGDRADRARLRRARPRPGAAAGQGVHDRADVPLRPPGPRPLPRALAAVARGDRLGGSGRRRRGDPVLLGAAAAARRDRVGAAAQLDRRRELPARGTSRG